MDDTNQKYDELELPTTLNGNPVGLYALYDILKREFPNRRWVNLLSEYLKKVGDFKDK